MRRPLFLVLALVLSGGWVEAQTTATLRGTVRDATRAVLAGAAVTVTGEETGLVRATTTNGAGLFSVAELPVGRYAVAVEYGGFRPEVRRGVVLNVAEVRALDFLL